MRSGWAANKKERIAASDTHICELPYIIAFFNLAFAHIACQKPSNHKIFSKLKMVAYQLFIYKYKNNHNFQSICSRKLAFFTNWLDLQCFCKVVNTTSCSQGGGRYSASWNSDLFLLALKALIPYSSASSSAAEILQLWQNDHKTFFQPQQQDED